MGILINLILSTIAVFAAAYILPGVHVDSLTSALIAAVVIGILNAILKPILVILTLPITLITLGLFTFVIQAILLLIADQVVPGLSIDGFIWALILSFVLTIINSLLNKTSSLTK